MLQTVSERSRREEAEREERERYRVLAWIYQVVGEDCDTTAQAEEVADDLALPREDVVRAVAHLARQGYLQRPGAGSRVCLTEQGLEYLQRGAWRRRSVRDP